MNTIKFNRSESIVEIMHTANTALGVLKFNDLTYINSEFDTKFEEFLEEMKKAFFSKTKDYLLVRTIPFTAFGGGSTDVMFKIEVVYNFENEDNNIIAFFILELIKYLEIDSFYSEHNIINHKCELKTFKGLDTLVKHIR